MANPQPTTSSAARTPAKKTAQAQPAQRKKRNLDAWKAGKQSLGEALGVADGDYQGLVRLAVRFYKQEDYPRARALLEGVEALGYDLGPQLAVLASVYQVLKENELAIKTYLRALKVTPNEPFLLTNLAELLLNRGRFPEAKDLLEKVIKLDPDKKHPAGARARALVVKGDRAAKGKR